MKENKPKIEGGIHVTLTKGFVEEYEKKQLEMEEEEINNENVSFTASLNAINNACNLEVENGRTQSEINHILDIIKMDKMYRLCYNDGKHRADEHKDDEEEESYDNENDEEIEE